MNLQFPTPDTPLSTSGKHRAVFLDRDGTLCEEVGYIDSIERLRLIPGSAEAIKLLNDRRFKVVMVTNQSGVARGYFPEEFLKELHAELSRRLREKGAFLDGIYYCPHHPSEGNAPYVKVCVCRKPAPGLLLRATQNLDLNLSGSYMVGDHVSDVECGQSVGAQTILLLTGHGPEAVEKIKNRPQPPSHIAADLYDAVQWIICRPEKR